MKLKIVICLVIGLFSACNRQFKTENLVKEAGSELGKDTIVASKVITDEIAGAAYRKKAQAYFLIANNDTSDFECIFAESNENGNVGIILNLPYVKRTITYRQIKDELKWILPEAAKDFNFDSLNYISYGRLILSGDLAVDISNNYIKEFGVDRNIKPG